MAPWYEKSVFYHIYPLGLCGAAEKSEDAPAVSGFAVGDEWIGHMKKIGCNAVYIGPLFESTSHGYDTKDYRKVDRRLGDNTGFKEWVAKCHEAGIHVVVDGVFNHTGRDFPAFKNLQEQKWDSWGKDWYCQVNFDGRSPLNDEFYYESWRGYPSLPRLNLKNPAVCDELMDVIRFWIEAFDIDGIRLDCADVLDFDFMRRMRRETAGLKEDFWLMGEVIHGDYSRWVQPDVLHSVTNYELHKGIYSAHNTHNYFEMAHSIRRLFGEYGLCRGALLYNFIDNHDVDRIASKLDNTQDLFPVYAFLMTIQGIPSIYYGSETGIYGRKENGSDAPLRPKLTVEEITSMKPKLLEWVEKLCHLRCENDILSSGQYEELLLMNRQFVYARVLDGKIIVTALNNDDSDCVLHVRIPGNVQRLTDIDNLEQINVSGGSANIHVKAHSGNVYKAE